MKTLEKKIDEIQDLLMNNKCLLDLTYEYCLRVEYKSEEATNISVILEIVNQNMKKAYEAIEDANTMIVSKIYL